MTNKSPKETSSTTSQKQTEDAQNETEDKFRSYFEHAPDGVFITDNSGCIVEANKSASRITGFSHDEILQMSIRELLAEKSKVDGLSHLKQIMEVGTATADLWHNHKDGTVRCLTIDAVKLSEDRILAFSKDITERKQAEIELAERNRFIESIVEMMPDTLYIYDLVEKKNVFSSKGIENILGYSIQEVQQLGEQILPLLMHPEDFPVYSEKILPRYATAGDREQIIHEYRMKHKSGDWRWISSNETIYQRKADGSPWQILGMIHDITLSKQNEDELRESKATAERYLNIAAEIIISLDAQGSITLMNDSGHALLEYEKGELIGKNWFDTCLDSDQVDTIKEVFAKLMTGDIENVANYENQVRTKNGKTKNIFWHNTLLRDAEDKIIGILSSGKDITQKQRLLEASQRTDKLESLGVLAGGIAHDFNNLLAGLFGYIDMARECHTENTLIADYLDKALNALGRARDLTQQLLTFSKGGAPSRTSGDLAAVIMDNARFALSGSNVVCKSHIAKELHMCFFDPNQVGQVIDNIVINAQQAMPLGGEIVITAQNVTANKEDYPLLNPGSYVKVSISDTGTGIQPKILKRIFDPFFSTKQKGNGLGLATCYSIMQKHEGLIDVDSVQGEGTTFRLFFPISEKISKPLATQMSSPHRGTGTFLVMDDEAIIRSLAEAMLNSMGYTVLLANNGEEAIRLFTDVHKSEQPVVGALLDLTIPGKMGGKETVARLHQLCPSLPVIASSGYSDDPIMTRPREFGFADSIPKPYRKNEMSEILNKHFFSHK